MTSAVFESDKQELMNWNNKMMICPEKLTVVDLFEAQVERNLDKVALVFEDKKITYGVLNKQANVLAGFIRKRYEERNQQKIAKDVCIGLCVSRGIEMIVGILGILKSGAAYVPIDPTYPKERVHFIANDASLDAIVVDNEGANSSSALDSLDQEIIIIQNALKINLLENVNLDLNIPLSSLAYVIYTSGSTGQPKGVMIEHGNVASVICAHGKIFFDFNDQVLQHLSICFDASVSEILTPLSVGATLHIIPESMRADIEHLPQYLEDHKITTAVFPASILTFLPKQPLKHLKKLIIGGEVGSAKVVEYWGKSRELYNTYGPTECTICSTYGKFSDNYNPKCIGKPISNTELYVLDEFLRPVSIGGTGELYIGGRGVARGYLNCQNLTKEKFIENPFLCAEECKDKKTKGEDTRLYKTGDLVRWLQSGGLEFIGRADYQIKLHGYRIELGEIESALEQQPEIKQSVVLFKEEAGRNFLVAYVLPQNVEKKKDLKKHWRAALKKILPFYMVPSFIMVLDTFPLTSNGKIDRELLPPVDKSQIQDCENYVAPTNELEQKLCAIWQGALGLEKVGISDDFFSMGGTSIMAMQVIHQTHKLNLPLHILVSDLFAYRSIKKIVEKCRTQTGVLYKGKI